MGGVLGIGQSGSQKTDRGNQLAATQADWNLFSQGMNNGVAGEAAGTTDLGTAKSTLGTAQQYFENLLTAGRTQTAASSAPAINATLAGADATRNAEGTFGTGRSGGTVAANRTAATTTQGSIDNIINQNLQTSRATGAQGLTQVAGLQNLIGSTELANAMQLLGLSSDSANSILNNATGSKATDPNTAGAIGSAVGEAYMNWVFG
jgi:hypothetical protein